MTPNKKTSLSHTLCYMITSVFLKLVLKFTTAAAVKISVQIHWAQCGPQYIQECENILNTVAHSERHQVVLALRILPVHGYEHVVDGPTTRSHATGRDHRQALAQR